MKKAQGLNEEGWNEAIDAVADFGKERKWPEGAIRQVLDLKKPVPKPEPTSEARLGILESDLERFFEGNGGLCGDDFRCLKRLISEVRRLRKERDAHLRTITFADKGFCDEKKHVLNVPFGKGMSSVTCNRTVPSEDLEHKICSEPNHMRDVRGDIFDNIFPKPTELIPPPKPHVHEWKEDLLERLRNCDWMQTCSICSCGATKTVQITEPK